MHSRLRRCLGIGVVAVMALGPHAAVPSELIVAAAKTPNGIDHDYHFAPEDHQIRAALYEKLMALGRTEGQGGLTLPSYEADDIEGRLAESWSLSEDGKTLTIKLRQGVKSHAGNELTADDLQWTWDRSWALDAVGAFYAKFILNIKEPSWKVVDKYSWQLTTPDVNALTVLLMVNNDLDVLDATEAKKHATDQDPWAKEWLATNEAGHGAYRLTEWRPGERVVLEAFADYYRGKSSIDKVVYREVPEAANRLALVAAGNAQIAESLPPRFLAEARKNSALRVWETLGNRLFRLDVNNEMAPTNDPRVRQALNLATPVDQIMSAVFYGFARQSRGPVPSNYPGAAAEFWDYAYDPEKAKALISEAGAEGAELTINLDTNAPDQKSTAVILKSAYEDVGLKVKLVEMSSAAYTSELYSGKFPAFFMTEFPILPDPGYALALNYPCGSFLNATHYCNKEVDKLLVEAAATLDQGERMKKYREIQKLMVVDDTNSIWIAEPGWQVVTTAAVEGIGWDTPNIYQFFDLRLK
ncbi:MAG: ABC transporter substrate-binding protein [Rhodospirillales bacterium]|nr:ABC transporter substrate-binding protein [Rhodospirillales bacterium]